MTVLIFQGAASATTPLASSTAQPEQHAKRAADPRRESTVLFKGFSASSAESGLLEIDEIADINGSPEVFRQQQAAPLSNPFPPNSSPHFSQSTLEVTSHSSDATGNQAASFSPTAAVREDRNHTDRLADIPVSHISTSGAAQQSQMHQQQHQQLQQGQEMQLQQQQQKAYSTQLQQQAQVQQQQQQGQDMQLHDHHYRHQQQQQEQEPIRPLQHRQMQQAQQQPLQHAIGQTPAAADSVQAELLEHAADLPDREHDSGTVPALDVERSSPRLQALAAANLPAGDDGNEQGSDFTMQQAQQEQTLLHNVAGTSSPKEVRFGHKHVLCSHHTSFGEDVYKCMFLLPQLTWTASQLSQRWLLTHRQTQHYCDLASGHFQVNFCCLFHTGLH